MLEALLFVVAMLYSSVGHAGASGYLMVMTLMGLSTAVMKPSSLALNILVATIGIVQFGRAKLIPWPLVWPLILASIPAAWEGGRLTGSMPDVYYKPLLGLVLLFSAWRLLASKGDAPTTGARPHFAKFALVGAAIGFLSGITSTGGGIFLSPLVLFLGWVDMKRAAGLSVAFILANSISGLRGQMGAGAEFPPELGYWMVAVALGGLLGTQMGSRGLTGTTLKKLLAVVLVVAALKLIYALLTAPPQSRQEAAMGSVSQSGPHLYHSDTTTNGTAFIGVTPPFSTKS